MPPDPISTLLVLRSVGTTCMGATLFELDVAQVHIRRRTHGQKICEISPLADCLCRCSIRRVITSVFWAIGTAHTPMRLSMVVSSAQERDWAVIRKFRPWLQAFKNCVYIGRPALPKKFGRRFKRRQISAQTVACCGIHDNVYSAEGPFEEGYKVS
jgi:hypothetical protein